MRILEALNESNGAGVSDLASELGMAKSTVHDHLTTLERDGYLINEDERYRLSTRFLEFGGHTRSQMRVFQIARPEIERLAKETGEHANLMIEENGKGVFLYVAKGGNAVTLNTVHHTGMRVHLHATALGKAILAFLDQERVEEIIGTHGLPQYTERTIGSESDLEEELTQIRERGYAIDNAERVQGMRCIGCPIVGEEEVHGAISVSAPTRRLDGEAFEKNVPDLLQRVANIIEVNLTYS